MVLLLPPFSVPSIRTFVSWLKVLLKHAFGRLKTCIRLALALASIRSSIIECSEGQTRILAASHAASSNTPGVKESNKISATNPTDPGNLAIPLLTGGQPPAQSSVNHPPGSPKVSKLNPVLASEIEDERYNRDLKVPERDENATYLALSGVPDFSEKIHGGGWDPLVHPEGALFFYQAHKRIITEADIRQSDIAKKIEQASDLVDHLVKSHNINLPKTAELVLRIGDGDTCGYYFVDHDSKSLFWAHNHEPDFREFFRSVPATEISHIRYAYEKQYWFAAYCAAIHCGLFPNKRIVQTDIVDRLKHFIMHAYADTVTSETSLAPYSVNDLSALMSLIGPLNESVGKAHEHSIYIISRLMQTFTEIQFLNFCGQPTARLDVDKSLYSPREEAARWKTLLLGFLNVALFGSLKSHKKSIERVWVDDSMVETRWKDFIAGLSSEWSSFTVFSTVMLAVDVSFLAVPGVASNSASLIMTYLSTISTMGSLVVSLILGSQVTQLEHAGTLFDNMSESVLGLDGLAMIYSLPSALLIWAMLFFAVALSIIIFQTSDAATLGAVAPVWALIMTLIGWPVLAINHLHISRLKEALGRISRVGRSNPAGQSGAVGVV